MACATCYMCRDVWTRGAAIADPIGIPAWARATYATGMAGRWGVRPSRRVPRERSRCRTPRRPGRSGFGGLPLTYACVHVEKTPPLHAALPRPNSLAKSYTSLRRTRNTGKPMRVPRPKILRPMRPRRRQSMVHGRHTVQYDVDGHLVLECRSAVEERGDGEPTVSCYRNARRCRAIGMPIHNLRCPRAQASTVATV